jgi:MFS transporter, SP family, general alpha glucoside:H+ symporter
MAQILCGNPLLIYSVVFLQAVGFSEIQAFDLNIALSACFIIGGLVCWTLYPYLGRATIYMSGLAFMFVTLIVIGGSAFSHTRSAQLVQGVVLVISTLANTITLGPTCYPIVSETPSGRLRYKTIAIGRFVYNLTCLVQNSITPRMLSPTCKSFTFRWLSISNAHTLIYLSGLFSVELGRQSGFLLCRHQPPL